MLERLKLQDEIIKILYENSSMAEEFFINKFTSSSKSRKSVIFAIENLCENEYIYKKKSVTGNGYRYSLSFKGEYRVENTFVQEYREKEENKELQRVNIESSILLTKQQIKQITFTNRLAWFSLIVSTLLALKTLFFENSNNSKSDYTESSRKGEKYKTNVKDSL